MKVLVTGASGFIGRHVVETMRWQGHEVLTMDCVGGAVYLADITKPLEPVYGLDAVIHLAALSHPRDCDADPKRAFDVNVNGTHQVLKMAMKGGARKVVFASSAHVYDIPPRYLPTDEMHSLRLNNTYTTTKILGEQLCELYYQSHGLSYTVLRLFNAYGPDQSLGYFIPDMIAKAKSGAVELTGSGTTKDWVHVRDIAWAVLLAAETSFVGAINIGTGVETNLHTIAGIIAITYGAKYTSTPGTNDTRMCADIGRAKRILGWQPQITLAEGLDAILNTSADKAHAIR